MSEALKVCCELLANSQHIIEEKNKEIARLTAEVARHRMTEEERHAAGQCADDSYGVAANYCVSDAASQSLSGYLERTAPKEPSNG